eukprot:3724568-Amphidinium_carterae.1
MECSSWELGEDDRVSLEKLLGFIDFSQAEEQTLEFVLGLETIEPHFRDPVLVHLLYTSGAQNVEAAMEAMRAHPAFAPYFTEVEAETVEQPAAAIPGPLPAVEHVECIVE